MPTQRRRAMHVSGLFVYPVKSLRGFAVAQVGIDDLGVVGDRRFMVIGVDGKFLTQRTLPRMALIETTLVDRTLRLHAPDGSELSVPLQPAAAGTPVTVSVWRSHGLLAEDCGEDAAAWLGSALGVRCRLVRIGAAFRRPVLQKPRHAVGVTPASAELVEGRIVTSDRVNFADGYPFMAISEGSLEDLNRRLAAQGESPVPMDRFRPNLVIAGADAFAEDTWPRIRAGAIAMRAAGPCSRCVVTTTDQRTAVRGIEPLRTLAQYRRDATDPSDVNFGQNFIHETKLGTLRVGDPVVAL